MSEIKLTHELNSSRREECEEDLQFNGINCGIYAVIGHWIISNDGDLLHEDCPNYLIASTHLLQTDWYSHLCCKDWFISEEKADFCIALRKAQEMVENLNKNSK